MSKISGIFSFLIFHFLFGSISCKNYQFNITYICENDEFEEMIEKKTKSINYVCKNWVEKISITEAKNTYARFDSKIRQKFQEIQQEEERDQEEQEQREQLLEKREQQEKQKRKQEREQRLKEIWKENQINKQITQPVNGKTPFSEKAQSEKTLFEENPQQIIDPAKFIEESSFNKSYDQTEKKYSQQIGSSPTSKLKQNTMASNNEQKVAPTQQLQQLSILPKKSQYNHQSHNLRREFDLEDNIEYHLTFRKHKQQNEEKQKFKLLKNHRSHPVFDILYMIEVVQMNNIIFQNSLFASPQFKIPQSQIKEKQNLQTQKQSQNKKEI